MSNVLQYCSGRDGYEWSDTPPLLKIVSHRKTVSVFFDCARFKEEADAREFLAELKAMSVNNFYSRFLTDNRSSFASSSVGLMAGVLRRARPEVARDFAQLVKSFADDAWDFIGYRREQEELKACKKALRPCALAPLR